MKKTQYIQILDSLPQSDCLTKDVCCLCVSKFVQVGDSMERINIFVGKVINEDTTITTGKPEDTF